MSLRSPLGTVLGHGSAKQGARHWWDQRLTAMALVPLGLWFLFAVLTLPDFRHATVAAWLARPLSAVLMLLFAGAALWHSMLGLQVVVEDYVGGRARVATLLALRLAHGVLAVLLLFSVLKLAIGTAA